MEVKPAQCFCAAMIRVGRVLRVRVSDRGEVFSQNRCKSSRIR